MTYDKEAIYDEQIAPLMTQILEITKREGMQMLASFVLKEEGSDTEAFVCTSYTPGDTYNNKQVRRAVGIIYPPVGEVD